MRQRGESAYRWQVRGELLVAGKDHTDRYCFDKAQLADGDWLVPLESAVIYCYYTVYSLAQQRRNRRWKKPPRLLRLERFGHVPSEARFRFIRPSAAFNIA